MPKFTEIANILRQKCKLNVLKSSDALGETLRHIVGHDTYLRKRLGNKRDAIVLMLYSPITGRSVRIENIHGSFHNQIIEFEGSQAKKPLRTFYNRLLEGIDVISVASYHEMSFQMLAIDARVYAWLERTFPSASASGGVRLAQAFLKRAISRRFWAKSNWFVYHVSEDRMFSVTCNSFGHDFCSGCNAKRSDGVGLRPCSACGVAHYCSAKCQIRSWRKIHRYVCAGIAGTRMLNMDDWVAFCQEYSGPMCPVRPVVK